MVEAPSVQEEVEREHVLVVVVVVVVCLVQIVNIDWAGPADVHCIRWE